MISVNLRVKKCKKSDLPECLPIFIKEFSENPYNEKWNKKLALKKLEEHFSGKNKYCFVAKENEKLIGFAFARTFQWHDGRNGFIEEIVVEKHYQGKGIGTKLYAKAESGMKKKENIRRVWLITEPSSRAWKFHERNNFKKTPWILANKKM